MEKDRITFYSELAAESGDATKFYVENHTFKDHTTEIDHPLDDITYYHARVAAHFASLTIALIEHRDRMGMEKDEFIEA